MSRFVNPQYVGTTTDRPASEYSPQRDSDPRFQPGSIQTSPGYVSEAERQSESCDAVLAEITDHPTSETSMIRKLSQEFYSNGARHVGGGGPGRHAVGVDRSHPRLGSIDETGRLEIVPPQPLRAPITIAEAVSLRDEPERDVNEQGDEELEVFADGTNFVRHHKVQMSLRKAFGIYEDCGILEDNDVQDDMKVVRKPPIASSSVSKESTQQKAPVKKGGRRLADQDGEHPVHVPAPTRQISEMTRFSSSRDSTTDTAKVRRKGGSLQRNVDASFEQFAVRVLKDSDAASSTPSLLSSVSGSHSHSSGSVGAVESALYLGGNLSSRTTDSPPPPTLPPRRYRNESYGSATTSGALSATTTSPDFEATLKPDTYAEQVRQQARRLSSQPGAVSRLSTASVRVVPKPHMETVIGSAAPYRPPVKTKPKLGDRHRPVARESISIRQLSQEPAARVRSPMDYSFSANRGSDTDLGTTVPQPGGSSKNDNSSVAYLAAGSEVTVPETSLDANETVRATVETVRAGAPVIGMTTRSRTVNYQTP